MTSLDTSSTPCPSRLEDRHDEDARISLQEMKLIRSVPSLLHRERLSGYDH